MKEFIKKHKAWLVPLGIGVAGGLAYFNVELPQWVKDLWAWLMALA